MVKRLSGLHCMARDGRNWSNLGGNPTGTGALWKRSLNRTEIYGDIHVDLVLGRSYYRVMDQTQSPTDVKRARVIRALVVAVRPRQWVKNLVIYLAFFFTLNEYWDLGDPFAALTEFGKATVAFVIFSALTGAVYLINDIFDVERDRLHPRKRLRPIASGQLSVSVAWSAAAVLAGTGLVAAFVFQPMFGLVSLAYVVSIVAYSMYLKQIVIIDVFTISGGFVLRAVAGAVVMQVPISPWLFICTGLAALLLALAKRRSELAQAGENAGSQRKSLQAYTLPFLDQLISVVATAAVVAYSLYTFTAENLPDNHAMMLTIPFVVYGLFRYLYIVHQTDAGENPEDVLLGDAPLATAITLWLISAGLVLALFR